ncbi:MAG: hypothetical protein PVG30_01965 [Gammaproteobacteria bacterium]|jgi:hypothetical protein
MKIRQLTKDHKKYYDGRLKYIAPTSKYEFINLFDERTEVDFEEVKTQIIKLREEFYELMAEPTYTIEFRKELFDLINAGINLAHCLSLYYDKNHKYKNDYEIYNRHVNKINRRLLNPDYNWGIKLEKEY